MALQKFTLYLVVGVGRFNHGDVSVNPYEPRQDQDPSFANRLLKKFEIETDVPEFDLVTLEIDALEKAVTKERADSQVKVNLLLERMSKLKAIGHDAN